MTMVEVVVFRTGLLLMLAVAVLVQLAVPGRATDFAVLNPEVTHLVIPYSAAAIAFIGCGEVVLLAMWRLLDLARSGDVHTRRALRWLDVIIGCAVVATGLIVAVVIHLIGFAPGGGGPTVYLLGIGIVGGVVSVLLLLVGRNRFSTAIADRP